MKIFPLNKNCVALGLCFAFISCNPKLTLFGQSPLTSRADTPAPKVTAPSVPKTDSLTFYNATLGKQFAADITAAVGGNTSSTGLCYLVVGNQGLHSVWPRGFYDDMSCSNTDLNCNIYARSFAERWKSSVHSKTLRLKPVYLKDNVNGESVDMGIKLSQAPVGSVLVWKQCSGSPAGHIAIVTQKGSQAISDFIHGLDVCPQENLIGIFVPTN